MNNYIYFHPDSEIYRKQIKKRNDMIDAHRFATQEVNDAMTIQVLLILIRHPGLREGDVAHRLKGHSPPITVQHIRVIFDLYSLDNVEQKKGLSIY